MTITNQALSEKKLARRAESRMPTRWGDFRLIVYGDGSGAEAMAIVCGDPSGEDVLVRIHSECWTGEALGSLRCDCREQLELALDALGTRGRGVIVYLRQEGRGIGLANKIRAYSLQDDGYDTVDANLMLGFAADLRNYADAAAILKELSVTSVQLMTNNAKKIDALERLGIRVNFRVPHWASEHEVNRPYITAKRDRLGDIA